jgi:hypothetical protein
MIARITRSGTWAWRANVLNVRRASCAELKNRPLAGRPSSPEQAGDVHGPVRSTA